MPGIAMNGDKEGRVQTSVQKLLGKYPSRGVAVIWILVLWVSFGLAY